MFNYISEEKESIWVQGTVLLYKIKYLCEWYSIVYSRARQSLRVQSAVMECRIQCLNVICSICLQGELL